MLQHSDAAGILNNMGKPITDVSGKEANPFLFGSGHFRPSKAADLDLFMMLCTKIIYYIYAVLDTILRT